MWPLKRFRDCNPSILKGSTEMKEAEDWIREMEKIFMRCTDDERLLLAEFSLKNEAQIWWEEYTVGFRCLSLMKFSRATELALTSKGGVGAWCGLVYTPRGKSTLWLAVYPRLINDQINECFLHDSNGVHESLCLCTCFTCTRVLFRNHVLLPMHSFYKPDR